MTSDRWYMMLVDYVPEILLGRNWTDETALKELRNKLGATEKEAEMLLKDALIKHPEDLTNVEVIHHALENVK